MEYTVQKLSELAGVSGRTLRYYDEIGLLKPAAVNPSGYRLYGPGEVDRLQQILFYRAIGVKLEKIREILNSPGYDEIKALQDHLVQLEGQQNELSLIIDNVKKTIANKEGKITMTDQEKFEGLKKKLVEENEQKYGKEVREKYGDDVAERSNNYFRNMPKDVFDRMNALAEVIRTTLADAVKTGDPAGELGQKAAALHKEWISICWGGNYSKEGHAGLAQMYVDDERFTAYYDKDVPGTAVFLRDAVHIFTGMKQEESL